MAQVNRLLRLVFGKGHRPRRHPSAFSLDAMLWNSLNNGYNTVDWSMVQ